MKDPSPERIALYARPWMARFLKAYRKYGRITMACRAVRKDRSTIHRYKREDPKFRAAMEAIDERLTDLLEESIFQRCAHGVKRPVNLGLHGVEYVRDYPDAVAFKMLAARRPYPYNRPSGDTGTGKDAKDTAREIRELVAQMAESVMSATAEAPKDPPPSETT